MKGWSPYPEQWFSNCVPQTSGASIPCEAVRTTKSPNHLGENVWVGQGLCASATQAALGITNWSWAPWLRCSVSFPS